MIFEKHLIVIEVKKLQLGNADFFFILQVLILLCFWTKLQM